MRTAHLFNSLRLVFNALAPDGLRLPGRVVRLRWSARYVRAAIVAMLRELRTRPLTAKQVQEMATMRQAAVQTFPTYQALLQ